MKNISTKDKFSDVNEGMVGVTYSDLLMVALRSAPSDKGVDSARIMKHFPIVLALQSIEVGAEIQLSKEDWATVASAWKEKTWPFLADSIGGLTLELEIEMKQTNA